MIVYLAQRFQVIDSLSPLNAGIHIIPYSAVATVATMLTCLASRRFRIPVVYFALLGSILHTVGISLFSTLPETRPYSDEGYGYEAISGAGVGITIGILTLAVPYIVETRDLGKLHPNFQKEKLFDDRADLESFQNLATATGALNQARFLGGAIGLAIASNILYGRLKSQLSHVLSPEEIQNVLERTGDIENLPKSVQKAALGIFSGSYTLQFQAMIAFAAAQIPSSLLILRRGRQYVAT